MEQEQATLSVSLEEPTEIIGQAPPAETPAETPAAATSDATVEADPEPEGVVYAANGQKLVPLGAVLSERGKRKEAERKAAELEPLKEKAQKYEEAKSYLEQAKPYIEKARADLQRPQTPPAPAVDEGLVQYAKDFDLYTAEGRPDVERATRLIKFHDDRNQKLTQQAVAPILQTEANRTAQGLYQQYVSRPEVKGVKVDGRMLAEAFNMVGPELIAANPAVAEVLYQNVLGRQLLYGHKPISAPTPVVPTESIGGGRVPEQAISATSEKFLQVSGMKPGEFKEVRERYKPGQPNSLE